jgi:hypothetical protein
VTDLIAGGRPDRLHAGSMGGLEKAGIGFESVLLSSTEGALSGRQRGHQARLVEMPLPADGFGIVDRPELCDPPVTDAASAGRWIEALVAATWNHHGHAYPRLVRRFLKLGNRLESEVHASMNTFRAATPEADGDAWARSVRENFALAYATGELACRFGIFPFGPEVVLDALRRCLLDALAHAAAPALAAAAQAEADSNTICAWLHENWKARVNANKPSFDARMASRQQIIASKDSDGSWVYLVRKEALAEVVPDPKRLDNALKFIAERGGLRPSKGEGKLTRQKPSVGGKLRFLFFTAAFARPNAPRS